MPEENATTFAEELAKVVTVLTKGAMPYDQSITAIANAVKAGFDYGRVVAEGQSPAVKESINALTVETLKPIIAMAKCVNAGLSKVFGVTLEE